MTNTGLEAGLGPDQAEAFGELDPQYGWFPGCATKGHQNAGRQFFREQFVHRPLLCADQSQRVGLGSWIILQNH